MLSIVAAGLMKVAGNLAPGPVAALYNAVCRPDLAEARRLPLAYRSGRMLQPPSGQPLKTLILLVLSGDENPGDHCLLPLECGRQVHTVSRP